ncbi:zinc ABC transporter substrate-binding protein [Nitrosopumilus sp.]|uniref:metal ABC transporter solute-binding protein, Zn/Mn family n=1 Tax=Nitrosopumilus sp. TaxID=2024843 RepID=UPI002622BAF2|nr:zinc ABC transporter substrate-binding protein [Nitrosopumilus sp.]
MSKNSSIYAIGGGVAAVAIAVIIAVTMYSGESENSQTMNDLVDQTNQEITNVQDTKIIAYASFYPYYEFTRNVAGDVAIVEQFMPSGVEAHDWEPRPQEIESMKDASVLVYNGLGMEPYVDQMITSGEFDNVLFIKASEGVELIKPEGHAFEWAGVFDVAAGTYTWSFAKVDGDYADPAMKMIILESDDIESSEELAETLLESDNIESKNDGNELVAKEVAYLLNFDESKEMTVFSVNIEKDGKYAFFTEHMPFEFEADEHFFKDASKIDVEPVMQEPDGGHGHHHHHHHAVEFDPHIWLDPVLVKQQVNNIRDGLIQADPQNKEQYQANAFAYNQKLDELDMNIKSSLSSCSKDTIVPYHNAFTYLAERHDFKVLALSGMAPHAEASAAKIAKFVNFVEENDIKVIFSEEIVDPRLAEVIAEEAGVEVLVLSPIETLAQNEIGKNITYLDKMEHNLDVLKIALECQ